MNKPNDEVAISVITVADCWQIKVTYSQYDSLFWVTVWRHYKPGWMSSMRVGFPTRERAEDYGRKFVAAAM